MLKSVNVKQTPQSLYKRCLIKYYGDVSLFRGTFTKPLKMLATKEPAWWSKFIVYSFEHYDEIKKMFGYDKYVARSYFPEPFIFLNKNIIDFLRQKIIDNECDWRRVSEIVKHIDNFLYPDNIMEFIENNKDKYPVIEILMAASVWCKKNDKSSLWEMFKSVFGNTIKQIL